MNIPLCRVLLLLCSITGCESPGQGVRETIDEDGFPLRLEIGVDEEPLDEVFLEAQMTAYRTRKAKTEADADAPEGAIALIAPDAFDPYEARGCPPEGSSKRKSKQKRNILKNRRWGPDDDDIDPDVTLKALRRPGYDRNRWSERKAATIDVYVSKIFGTGAESCNCKATSRKLTDTHMDVIAYEGDKRRKVVVEVTPVWRLIHEHFGWEDWSSAALRKKYEGRKVRITGWLYFDESHVTGADNTDPENDDGEKNWRATCWELHPVTNIELID